MKYCKIIVVRLVALHIESPICTDNTVSHSPWHSLSFKMYVAHIIWDCFEISYETFPVKMKVLEIVKNEIHVSFVL